MTNITPQPQDGPKDQPIREILTAEICGRIAKCLYRANAATEALISAAPEITGVPSFIISSRCRANIMYDKMTYFVREEFKGEYGVRFVDKPGFLLMCLGDLVRLRFKKVNIQYQASNIKTRQQRLYDRQQLVIDGMDDKANDLTVGYRYDEITRSIEEIAITYFLDGTLLWKYTIPAESKDVTIPLFGEEDGASPAPVIRPRVKQREERIAS